MSWMLQKLDVFLAGVVIAAAGIFASQSQIFAVQYIRHADVQLVEARAHLEDVQGGLRFRTMGDQVRGELEAEAKAQVAKLEGAGARVRDANFLIRPLVMYRQGEPSLIDATHRDFVPALPKSAGLIAFTILGMLIGFAIYEAIKLPLAVLAREPRRRKFRKRG